ncbi:MAG: hypothetical protein AB7E42_00015 [Anaerotignaceae bacterium]
MTVNTKKEETVKDETTAPQVELQDSETVEKVDDSSITDAQCVEDAKKWGAVLAKEPKRTIKIKGKNNKDTEPVPVGINGYFYFINKNESIEVPQSVARVLEEADYI